MSINFSPSFVFLPVSLAVESYYSRIHNPNKISSGWSDVTTLTFPTVCRSQHGTAEIMRLRYHSSLIGASCRNWMSQSGQSNAKYLLAGLKNIHFSQRTFLTRQAVNARKVQMGVRLLRNWPLTKGSLKKTKRTKNTSYISIQWINDKEPLNEAERSDWQRRMFLKETGLFKWPISSWFWWIH